MDNFDFNAEAELSPSRAKGPRQQPVGYKRFERAANAIRLAMEELATEPLVGAYLEISEECFNAQQSQPLYERQDYPGQAAGHSSSPLHRSPSRWAQ